MSRKYAKLIKPDGTLSWVSPANGKDFKYDELTTLIEAEICQWVDIANGQWMVVDEEYLLKKGQKFNRLATKIYHVDRDTNHPILGNALVCDKDMIK